MKHKRDKEIGWLDELLSEKYRRQVSCYELFGRNALVDNKAGKLTQFRRVCSQLIRLHRFSPILRFVQAAFAHREEIDLAALREQLSQNNVRENYTLADLCQDYLLDWHEHKVQSYDLRGCDIGDIPADVDLYASCPEDMKFSEPGGPRECQVIPQTLLKKVYGLECGEVTPAVIDELVAFVRQQAADAHEEECRRVVENNQEIDFVRERGAKVGRYVRPAFTEFERDAAIPGLLLPFLIAADYQGKTELFYYILEKYAVPALVLVPWEQKAQADRLCMAQIVSTYADCLEGELSSADAIRSKTIRPLEDHRNFPVIFYYEPLGKGDPSRYFYATSAKVDFSCAHEQLFRRWVEVLSRGGRLVKDVMRAKRYSYHMLMTPFLLCLCGQQEAAARFFLQNRGEISDAERRKPEYLILLVRSILASSDVETANALYGHFSYELSMAEHSKEFVHEVCAQMVQFLRDAQAYIREADEYTWQDEIPWYEILYGSGSIDCFLDRCAGILSSGRILPVEMYMVLADCVKAFSHPTGVHLDWLGLQRYDGYNKLENALSHELRVEGQALADRRENVELRYMRMNQRVYLDDVKLHLQSHLYDLQSKMLTDNLKQVSALKQRISEDTDDEKLLEEISAIAEKLVGIAQSAHLWRPAVEQYITNLRESFEKEYAQGADLMEKLPDKIRRSVHNCLVTSNLVLRMLETQGEEKLDYSAALVSMTKALEIVMGYIYSRMEIKEYEGISEDTRKFYFDQHGKPIEKQTLRPCIELLSNVKRFEIWGGNEVLELKKLGDFRDIPLTTGTDKTGKKRQEQFRSGRNMGENARKLQSALGYICENYRNRCAHAEAITIMDVRACQELLIEGERLLWIVLAILKSEKDKA